METVRFQPNERVDIPDAHAIGFLGVAEFRRTLRGLMLGEAENKLINGFRTNPTGPASAIVNVVLDPGGGGWLSFALGAEQLSLAGGGSRVDRGVLIGGDNSYSELGGNASYPVDFTGAPNGDYIVEMRFTLIAGKSDNRVFVDPVLKVESTNTTNTRWIPALEVRRISGTTPTAGGNWFPLAQIAWDGTSIDSGDIIDRRTFAAEGSALAGFRRQGWGTTGPGMPDFDRSTDRANIGLNALYPLVRALMRQVQDIKGQTGGWLSWFARGTQPMGVGSGTLTPTDQTKGMAENSETCVFTVGDGVSEWGDFSGTNGLQSCLAHIESVKATLPGSVTVLLKTRELPGTVVFELSTPVDLSDISVTIKPAAGNELRGRVLVDFTHAGFNTPYFLSNGSTSASLTLIGIDVPAPSGGHIVNPIADVQILEVRDCKFAVSDASDYLFRCQGDGSSFRSSNLAGRIYLSGGSPVGSARDCVFDQIVGRSVASDASGQETHIITRIGTSRASGLRVTNSSMRRIDGRGTSDVVIEGCAFSCGNEDGIVAGYEPVTGAGSVRWTIRDCYFTKQDISGDHANGAGTNGALGTGWGIYVAGGPGDTARTYGMTIENIRFGTPPLLDAGCVRIDDAVAVHIKGIDLSAATWNYGSTRSHTTVLLSNVKNAHVSECVWDGLNDYSGPASLVFRGVHLTGARVSDITITNNIFTMRTTWTNPAYSVLVDATVIRKIRVVENDFLLLGTNVDSAHVAVTTSTNARDITVSRNTFLPNAFNRAHVIFGGAMGPVRVVHVDGNTISPEESGNSGTGDALATIGARLLYAPAGTRLVFATCNGNVVNGTNQSQDAVGSGTSLLDLDDPYDISIQQNVIFGYTTDTGAWLAEAVIRLNLGMNMSIIGNIHDGNAADTNVRSMIITGGAIQIFTNNRFIGSASHDSGAPAGVWNVNNSVTGGVTP